MLAVTNMLLHGIEDPSFGGREEDGIESNFPQQYRTRETADLFLALIIRLLKPGGRAAVVLPDGTLFGEGVKTRLKEHLLAECNLHAIVRLPNSVFRIRDRAYSLDIKNPHTVADDHGDPEALLADLTAAETQAAALRDQIKAVLAEALTR